MQEERAGELLGESRAALLRRAGAQVVQEGAGKTDRIDPRVMPEPVILDGDQRLDEKRRGFLQPERFENGADLSLEARDPLRFDAQIPGRHRVERFGARDPPVDEANHHAAAGEVPAGVAERAQEDSAAGRTQAVLAGTARFRRPPVVKPSQSFLQIAGIQWFAGAQVGGCGVEEDALPRAALRDLRRDAGEDGDDEKNAETGHAGDGAPQPCPQPATTLPRPGGRDCLGRGVAHGRFRGPKVGSAWDEVSLIRGSPRPSAFRRAVPEADQLRVVVGNGESGGGIHEAILAARNSVTVHHRGPAELQAPHRVVAEVEVRDPAPVHDEEESLATRGRLADPTGSDATLERQNPFFHGLAAPSRLLALAVAKAFLLLACQECLVGRRAFRLESLSADLFAVDSFLVLGLADLLPGDEAGLQHLFAQIGHAFLPVRRAADRPAGHSQIMARHGFASRSAARPGDDGSTGPRRPAAGWSGGEWIGLFGYAANHAGMIRPGAGNGRAAAAPAGRRLSAREKP